MKNTPVIRSLQLFEFWIKAMGTWGDLFSLVYMTTQYRYDPRDIILYIDSFKVQIILYIYVYKVLKRKIWKSVRTLDDNAFTTAFTQRSLVSGRHDVSAPVKLKRRLKGAVCTTPNTIVIHIRLCTVYTRRRGGSNNYIIRIFSKYLPS